MGIAYGDNGDVATSIDIFKQLVEQNGENFDARIALASAYEKEGRVTDAIREYQRALITRPEDMETRRRLDTLEMTHEQ